MVCKHTFGGACIVTGTAVGAGMLALPIATGIAGFLPAVLVYFICWLVMVATGLLYLELALIESKDKNLISMSHDFLGKGGQIVTWIVYIFLLYCITVSYISYGGEFFYSVTGGFFPKWAGYVFFVLIFGFFVYRGTLVVDRTNLILMAGLGLSYILFIIFGSIHVDFSNFKEMNWSKSIFISPIILLSFAYQVVIPSLTTYLKKDVKRLRIAIIMGISFTLIIYLIWEFLILGIVPLKGEHGIIAARRMGLSAIEPLKHFTGVKQIYVIGQFFGFFAIATSFLGMTLGLFDFLADGLKIPKKGSKKLFIAFLTFVPPLMITLSFPNLFFVALEYAGGFGVAILVILLPALMAYSARYFQEKKFQRQIGGGKALLFFIIFFALFEIALKLIQDFFPNLVGKIF